MRTKHNLNKHKSIKRVRVQNFSGLEFCYRM